jgi:hypothetical protein
MQIEIISTTKDSEEDFWTKSALGISLRRISFDPRIVPKVSFNYTSRIAIAYNERIRESQEDNILVFIHADVWIDDHFFSHRVTEGLEKFNMIGVAGNSSRIPFQPAWAFINTNFEWDKSENLSGSICHGQYPFGEVGNFGPTPVACELMDGVFMATKRKSLIDSNTFWDTETYDYHFTDVDFCRTARTNGLTLGTWPISLTHQSSATMNTDSWRAGYQSYIDKWGS